MPRPFEVWVENLLLPAFFCENLSATYSAYVPISALRWTEFHQNCNNRAWLTSECSPRDMIILYEKIEGIPVT